MIQIYELMPPCTVDLDYEDPFSRCLHTEHPCVPGRPCALDAGTICDPECPDYMRYPEEPPD